MGGGEGNEDITEGKRLSEEKEYLESGGDTARYRIGGVCGFSMLCHVIRAR